MRAIVHLLLLSYVRLTDEGCRFRVLDFRNRLHRGAALGLRLQG
jgi:hypothetical protein